MSSKGKSQSGAIKIGASVNFLLSVLKDSIHSYVRRKIGVLFFKQMSSIGGYFEKSCIESCKERGLSRKEKVAVPRKELRLRRSRDAWIIVGVDATRDHIRETKNLLRVFITTISMTSIRLPSYDCSQLCTIEVLVQILNDNGLYCNTKTSSAIPIGSEIERVLIQHQASRVSSDKREIFPDGIMAIRLMLCNQDRPRRCIVLIPEQFTWNEKSPASKAFRIANVETKSQRFHRISQFGPLAFSRRLSIISSLKEMEIDAFWLEPLGTNWSICAGSE
ncbi:hypothetical protein Tco_0373455 [Tanacetum coccineum]